MRDKRSRRRQQQINDEPEPNALIEEEITKETAETIASKRNRRMVKRKVRSMDEITVQPSITSKEMIVRDITMEKTRLRLQELQDEFVDEIEQKVKSVISKVIKEVEYSENDSKLFIESDVYANRKRPEKDGVLPEKHFMARNSLLTDLFAIKHIRTIYHIFVAILIILLLNTLIHDFVDCGRPKLGVELIIWSFGELQTVIVIWIGMQAAVFTLYLMFHFFASNRQKVPPRHLKVWDKTWLILFIFYLLVMLHWPLKNMLEHSLPPASSLIILMEQVRFLMKSYAFVRSNITKVLDHSPKNCENDKGLNSPCPGFSQFLYFLFIPTLVYKDSYPRSKQVHWREVTWSFLEVIGVIFYISFIFDRLLKHEFQDFGKRPVELKAIVVSIFNCMMPATLAMLCAFFCLLHSWQNAFADMLCFSDRMFYKDWWNSTSFAAYYRTWNVIVHDWLYTYIYKDFSELVMPNDRIVPKLMVFAVSAIFHEYILTFAFGYFYPVMLLLFGGAGVALSFVQRKDAGGNVFMWLSLCMGTGLFMSLYSMEWYARVNCPQIYDFWFDKIIPRSWTCKIAA